MFKKTLLLAGASYLIVNQKVQTSPEPPTSMFLRGEYENKIRRFSPPQKIFDVFATIYEKGNLLMTMEDLLTAICFYNYSMKDESDTIGFKPHNILKFLGKETRFEIYDYFILVRFLAYERNKIKSYFENKGIQSMNEEEFLELLGGGCCADYKDHIKQNFLLQSRQFKPKKEQFENRLKQVAGNVFKGGKQRLSYEQIINFRRSIICDLYEFEFLSFPIKDGHIDGVDFARSIVKYVQPNKTRKFMKRIKTIQDIEEVRVDKEAYIGFHLYMQTNITELEEILNKKGAINTAEFSNLINLYVKEQYHVTSDEIEVITKLLDYDASGFLEKREILGVLKNLQYYTTVKSGDTTFIESMKKDWEKIVFKTKKIMEILEE